MSSGITHELKHKAKNPFPPKKARHISNLKKEASVPKGAGWTEVRDYLDDTEARLEEFAKRADKLASKVEGTAQAKKVESSTSKDESDSYFSDTKAWINAQIEKARDLEAKAGAKAEELVDVARVKTHLAKMEVSDVTEEVTARMNKVMGSIDQLKTKVTTETGDMLKSLSDACLALRDKVVQKH